MASEFRWIGQSEDGQTVTLKRFNGKFEIPSFATAEWLARHPEKIMRVVGVDVETTGLDRQRDKVIEIGLLEFCVHRETGEILSIENAYSGFEDPGVPISETVTRLTGITQKDVEGQQIDWGLVDEIVGRSELVVAHNAGFDRSFIDARAKRSQNVMWGCSLAQVDWAAKGFNVRKLEVLCIYHGFFTNAHRALHDVEAMVHLLSFKAPGEQTAYFAELIKSAQLPLVKMIASQSPFESKDFLKRRGYRWDAQNRFWHKSIPKDEQDKEKSWLESTVYGGVFRGRLEDIPLVDNFKS